MTELDISKATAVDMGPVGVWSTFEGLRESTFFGEYLNRLVTGRDMNVQITAASETGVGKTTLAVALAMMMDQHGWTHDKAAVASAIEYDRLYDQVPPGSALILDEAEKAVDSRRGMKTSSVTLSQSFATKRYRQVFSILTAPSKSWIDKRLSSDAADYWIQVQETDMGRIKGEARVYRLKTDEHYDTDYAKRTEFLSWPNLDGHPEFERLDQRKRDLLESDDSDSEQWYTQKELNEAKATAERQAKESVRNELIKSIYETQDLTQREIGEAVDLSRSRVASIVTE